MLPETQEDTEITLPNSEQGNEADAGQADDFDAFWQEEEEKETQSSKPQETSVTNPQQTVDSILGSLKFTELSQEEQNAIANGDMQILQRKMHDVSRSAVQNTLLLTAKMMQSQQESMRAEFQRMMQTQLQDFQNRNSLVSDLPIADDPSMRPIVEGIFNTALRKSGNDAKKAKEMTRKFLSVVAKKAAESTGQSLAAPETAQSRRSDANIDFMKFLTNG